MEDKSGVRPSDNSLSGAGSDRLVVAGLGCLLALFGGYALLFQGEKLLVETAVSETLWVVVYLTMLVAYTGLKMPVFFPRSPFLSTFSLVFFAGHISIFFDSFAVAMLIATGINFLAVPGKSDGQNLFNQLSARIDATFAALTVGLVLFVGEIYSLPFYITNNLATLTSGLPLLPPVTFVCFVLAFIAAKFYPVKMEPVVFDRAQLRALAEFVVGLLLIIFTHSPLFCIGVLIVYAELRRSTTKLIASTLHEFSTGALSALGLIICAVVIHGAGYSVYIQPYLYGWVLFFGAIISSPFTGAMAPPVADLYEFYKGLAFLAVGATLLPSSSLVGIMVFKGRIPLSDLPAYLQRVAGTLRLYDGRESVHEGVVYTLLVLPRAALLAGAFYFWISGGYAMAAAEFFEVTMN